MKKLSFYFILSLLTIFNLDMSADAAQINRATITEIKGNEQQVYINNNHARLRDVAFLNDRVRTGQARLELKLNTGAVARIGTNTSLKIGSKCALLTKGNVLIDGRQDICTGTGSTFGVRGTVFSVSIDDFNNTSLKVLEGKVEAKTNDSNKTITVKGGEKLTIDSNNNFGAVEKISPNEYNDKLSQPEFFDFKNTLPQIDKVNAVYNQMLLNYKIQDGNLIRPSVLPKLK